MERNVAILQPCKTTSSSTRGLFLAICADTRVRGGGKAKGARNAGNNGEAMARATRKYARLITGVSGAETHGLFARVIAAVAVIVRPVFHI